MAILLRGLAGQRFNRDRLVVYDLFGSSQSKHLFLA